MWQGVGGLVLGRGARVCPSGRPDPARCAPSAGPPPPCSISDEWVCDATVCGGRARYINHSCDPNCYSKIYTAGSVRKIGIFAKRHVQRGEELFYDYKVTG